MAEQVNNNQAILKRVGTLEAMAQAIINECQQTRKLLEKADVSTPADKQHVSKIAHEARTRLRARILNSSK